MENNEHDDLGWPQLNYEAVRNQAALSQSTQPHEALLLTHILQQFEETVKSFGG
jgi:hypothetical protein